MPKVNILSNSSRIKVSLDDNTADFLLSSITTGSGISVDSYTDGSGDVLLQLSLDGSPTPAPHAPSHQDGSGDEINVGALSGVLADRQDADKLYGRDISSSAPADDAPLVWDAEGSSWGPENNVGMGKLPAVSSSDFGLYATASSGTLGLWSARTSASDGVSVQVGANVNTAAINAAHKILTGVWVNDNDEITEAFNFKEDSLEFGSGSSVFLIGTEADGGSVVACTVGSEDSYTTLGGKLLSVVNADAERAAVDYRGDLSINKLDNGQGIHFKSLTELMTVSSGEAYTDSSLQIPAYSQVSAVTTRVVTSIPTSCTYDIGVSGGTTRYGTSCSGTAGVTTFGLEDGVRYYSAGTPVRVTPSVTPPLVTPLGQIRITVHYMTVDVPTS